MMEFQPKASHFVDGDYIEDTNGAAISCVFPASGEEIARLHSATSEIVELAVKAARQAQIQWASRTGTERGRVLKRAADIIRKRNEELSWLETHDTGKPLQETICADATSGADSLEYFGGLVASLTGQHIPLGADWAYTKRIPLGVCAGIGAWNYPTQIACWKAAPALACGNAMVFKPSEFTPLCALKIAEIFIEAGVPAGLFNVVQGYGDVGAALTEHAGIDKVSLTGSAETGARVYASAAAGMKHVTMELGGKSPLIVFDDASLEDAVGGALLGNFYSTGQVCSNGTRVFVQSGIKERFLERLVERTAKIVIGDPRDDATQMGPMVSARQLAIVESYIAKGKAEGATLVYGGAQIDQQGFFIEPVIFSNVTDDMTIARQEIFGPVMSVLEFETEEEVIARANDTELGLAAGIFTSDLTRAHRVIDQLDAGSCFINTYNEVPVEIPFGGMKKSGFGRENSKAAIEHYSQLKTVFVKMTPVEAPY